MNVELPSWFFSEQSKATNILFQKYTYLNVFACDLGTGPLKLLYDKSLKNNLRNINNTVYSVDKERSYCLSI